MPVAEAVRALPSMLGMSYSNLVFFEQGRPMLELWKPSIDHMDCSAIRLVWKRALSLPANRHKTTNPCLKGDRLFVQ
jgi:hypothetical protein